MGPRVGLDAVAKREMSLHFPCWDSNLGIPGRSLVTITQQFYIYAFSDSVFAPAS